MDRKEQKFQKFKKYRFSKSDIEEERFRERALIGNLEQKRKVEITQTEGIQPPENYLGSRTDFKQDWKLNKLQ